jgi:hypothetical protein
MKLLATSSKRKGGINACAGLADGAFADLLHKHGRPADLKRRYSKAREVEKRPPVPPCGKLAGSDLSQLVRQTPFIVGVALYGCEGRGRRG